MKQIKEIDINTIEIDGKIYIKEVEEPKTMNYEDVCKELFLNKIGFFVSDEEIKSVNITCNEAYFNMGNEATTKEELENLLCLGKLRNIAKYLNPKGWKYEANVNVGYYLSIWNNKIDVERYERTKGSHIFFKSEELALQALEILGEETIRKALNQQP